MVDFGIQVAVYQHLRHTRRVRVRPIRKFWMIPPTWVVGIGIWINGRSRVEVIDIIDFNNGLGSSRH